MRVRLLGSLRVANGDSDRAITAAKQRVILAALSLSPSQPVSPDRLASMMWDGSPPPGARVTVRSHVRALRQVLGPDLSARIMTTSSGYLLHASDEEVDTREFSRLCAGGRAAVRLADWPRAWELLGAALSLWRGPALADVPSEELQRDQVPLLDSMRLQAAQWHADAGLALGRHEELLVPLQALCREHPLLERCRAQLMLALYRSGRQAEALAAYSQARQTLIAELGVDPGPELHDLHQRILADDPCLALPDQPSLAGQQAPHGSGGRAGAVPRQLPPGPGWIADREAEVADLTRLMDEARRDGRVAIAVITGAPGVGKTALAVDWAHRVAGEFPDGQLYVNLGGFGPPGTTATPAQVAREFLAALGVRAGEDPALLRSALAGKRVLIVLDNARDTAQVEPLLPGSPGSLVLITSRGELSALAARYGAGRVMLDVLSEAGACLMLTRRLGSRRAGAEPAVIAELASQCGRLPLALAVAAARAAARPHLRLADLAGELRDADAALDVLDAGEATASVRAVLSWSYQRLTAPCAGAFRLLALHPGPDITAPAAASLIGVTLPEARRLLRELAAAHLLAEEDAGRFAFHDLLRAYARERVSAEEDAGARQAATQRMFGHYLHSAQAAARLLYPVRDPLALAGPPPGVAPEHFTGRAQALDWLQAEYRVLRAVGMHAAACGAEPTAWQLPAVMTDFLNRRGLWQDLADAHRAALSAAYLLGDQAAMAHAHHGLGTACSWLGSYDDSRAHLERAGDLFGRLGDQARQARNQVALGTTFAAYGQLAAAWSQTGQALRLYRQLGHRLGHALALGNLGSLAAGRGRYKLATAYCQRALAMHKDGGNDIGAGYTLESLGDIHHHLGHHVRSIGYYRQAASVFTEVGDRPALGRVYARLGDACDAAADPRGAREAWLHALDVLDGLHQGDAAQVRAKLAAAAGADCT